MTKKDEANAIPAVYKFTLIGANWHHRGNCLATSKKEAREIFQLVRSGTGKNPKLPKGWFIVNKGPVVGKSPEKPSPRKVMENRKANAAEIAKAQRVEFLSIRLVHTQDDGLVRIETSGQKVDCGILARGIILLENFVDRIKRDMVFDPTMRKRK